MAKIPQINLATMTILLLKEITFRVLNFSRVDFIP